MVKVICPFCKSNNIEKWFGFLKNDFVCKSCNRRFHVTKAEYVECRET